MGMKILVIGTGEYVVGLVEEDSAGASSDKSSFGVILPVLFDLRDRFTSRIESILLAGSRGTQMPLIRQHIRKGLASRYKNMNVALDATFPEDDIASDPQAYKKALTYLRPGDGVIIFTPDHLHFEMAMEATARKLHILLAKPAVKTVREHLTLLQASKRSGSFIMIDFHKRWDPIYRDARKRMRHLGPMNYFQSFMSQPKSQLRTFRRWAGQASDISYYLNSHHIDFHLWAMQGLAEPICVSAFASRGIACCYDASLKTQEEDKAPRQLRLPPHTEDTITLVVEWRSSAPPFAQNDHGHQGLAQYTASWVAAPKAEVHSQQRFHYMAKAGEIYVDQAHRGYRGIEETSPWNHYSTGLTYYNPLYMTYLPDIDTGEFDGQACYGYQSVQSWLEGCLQVNEAMAKSEPVDWDLLDQALPTLKATLGVTRILAAGRESLDSGKGRVELEPLT